MKTKGGRVEDMAALFQLDLERFMQDISHFMSIIFQESLSKDHLKKLQHDYSLRVSDGIF